MSSPCPSPAQGRAQFRDADRLVRPPAGHDGIGNALRAIYDDRLTSTALPDDFAVLIDRLG